MLEPAKEVAEKCGTSQEVLKTFTYQCQY